METSSLPANVGFIGLGIMGYPMAANLAAKLPESSKLHIYDISAESLSKLQTEAGEKRVHICKSSKEVAEQSVRIRPPFPRLLEN